MIQHTSTLGVGSARGRVALLLPPLAIEDAICGLKA